MSNYILFEDGVLTHGYNGVLWAGLFSVVRTDGKIIEYIQSCLPKNTLCLIPQCDGNMNSNPSPGKFSSSNWETEIQPFINDAKQKNKVFILGTLCQIDEEPDCNYLYIPLDDGIFHYGITNYFNKETIPPWENRSSQLYWRGCCSGLKNIESKTRREHFVEKINHIYNKTTDVKLTKSCDEKTSLPSYYFDERCHYTEFLKYKIFFIVDGNCIASNHMYGFSTGCIPFVISNAVCWYSHLVVPYTHYIPINYDLSNLIEQIEWVKNNDSDAKKIAENAYKFAETYFSSEYQQQYIKNNIDKFRHSVQTLE